MDADTVSLYSKYSRNHSLKDTKSQHDLRNDISENQSQLNRSRIRMTRSKTVTPLSSYQNKPYAQNGQNPENWGVDLKFERFIMRMNRGTLPEEFYEDIEGKLLIELYRRYQDIRLKR